MLGEGLGRLTVKCVCVAIILWAGGLYSPSGRCCGQGGPLGVGLGHGLGLAAAPVNQPRCDALKSGAENLEHAFELQAKGTNRWATLGEELAEAWSDVADCLNDSTGIEAARERGLAVRRAVLAGYPMYKKADHMLWMVAHTLVLLGRETEAMKVARDLVRVYPQSKLVPDALVTLGDLSFSANDMMSATRAYDVLVAKYPKSVLVPYATYKRSWCSFNLGDYADALKRLVKVLAIAKKAHLIGIAQKDLVRVYAHVGKPSAGFKMFRKWAGKRAFQLTRRLAATYEDVGKYKEAQTVYAVLVRQARAANRQAMAVAFRRDAIVSQKKAEGPSAGVVKATEKLLTRLAAELKGASSVVKASVRKDTRLFVVKLIAEVTALHVRTREPQFQQHATALRRLLDKHLP